MNGRAMSSPRVDVLAALGCHDMYIVPPPFSILFPSCCCLATTGAVGGAAVVGALQEYWFAFDGDTTVPEELEVKCGSEQLASTVHPSEATWICEYRCPAENVVAINCHGLDHEPHPPLYKVAMWLMCTRHFISFALEAPFGATSSLDSPLV